MLHSPQWTSTRYRRYGYSKQRTLVTRQHYEFCLVMCRSCESHARVAARAHMHLIRCKSCIICMSIFHHDSIASCNVGRAGSYNSSVTIFFRNRINRAKTLRYALVSGLVKYKIVRLLSKFQIYFGICSVADCCWRCCTECLNPSYPPKSVRTMSVPPKILSRTS